MKCPTCDKEFESKRAVAAHHGHHKLPYYDAKIEREKVELASVWLEREYHEKGRSSSDIGEELGCGPSTVLRMLRRHGIETKKSNRDKPPWFGTDSLGYESIKHNTKHGKFEFRLHRLMAIAKYGFEKVCDNDVHHKTNIPWDNRMSNIELLSHSEHRRQHAIEEAKSR